MTLALPMPQETLKEHDAIMASAPIEYRGYMIKPISFARNPHYTTKFHYWGWIAVKDGAHACPGAAWCKSAGRVKTLIDCLYEAGAPPPLGKIPAIPVERAEALKLTEARRAWNERFWTLMRERD